jgi:spermidine synthase
MDVVLGDGRLSLAAAPPHGYDLLVVDAFNSDAIPIHLLTREALSLYLGKLSESGIILFHLSNRFLDLEPVVGRLAQAAGLSAVIRENTARTRSLVETGAAPSIWAALSPRATSLTGLQHDPQWRQLRVSKRVRLWTDDFSNIFSVYRWPRLR